MSIQFSQPIYFFLVLIVIPAFAYSIVRSKKMIYMMRSYSLQHKKTVHMLTFRIFFRMFSWSLAWICMCVALAKPTWGTELVPVQRSGRAVSFVFDISYSMNATDVNSGTMTRLDSCKIFSENLLSTLPGVATSAVLAKGDGVLAVPLTEDYYAISNLISSLSPNMLSHPGSSLSKGILKAIESFPPQSARSSFIIVMSDGDDTDGSLFDAVEKAVEFGIHVVFVGFGSQTESEVLAGDGVTYVKTALRAEKLQNIAQRNNVDFIFADESSAQDMVVEIIKPSIFFSDNATTTNYEIASIQRHRLFIGFAITFFLLGCLIFSFVPTKIIQAFRGREKTIVLVLFMVSSGFFTGCTDWLVDSQEVLEGAYHWSQQNYQQSVASFLEVNTRAQETESIDVLQYGLFGLSSSYLMQGETEASLAKINEMDPIVSPSLDFARWYNKGIIFHRHGEYKTAAFCFKKALLIDGSNINAKTNLELCLDGGTVETQQGIQERIPASEQKNAPPGAAEAVFSLIREREENQWKTQEIAPEKSDIIDY